jgi:STE24 endopeptidase
MAGGSLAAMNEDRASRYQRLSRRASMASVVWAVIFLSTVLFSGASHRLRDLAIALAAILGLSNPTATVVLYVAALAVPYEAGQLVLAYHGGFLLERRYGLSTQAVGRWFVDRAKAAAVIFVFGAFAVSLIYWTIRVSPTLWWLLSGLLLAMLLTGLAGLAPILLVPLFGTVRPLSREDLCQRLLRLADRAGAQVLGAYEWGMGDTTPRANAALTGIGSTRRILVSERMLTEYSDDEIEVVLAHELAHHVHGDLWKGLAFDGALVVAGCFLSARSLSALSGLLGLEGVSDVAGLPVLALSAGAVSMVMLPAAHAMSRAHERRADRFALELTRNPEAFIAAIRRLAAQHLAEERPSRIVQWLFHSHPSIGERIAAAKGTLGASQRAVC